MEEMCPWLAQFKKTQNISGSALSRVMVLTVRLCNLLRRTEEAAVISERILVYAAFSSPIRNRTRLVLTCSGLAHVRLSFSRGFGTYSGSGV